MMLAPLPQHDREPACGDAEERSGKRISEEMEIGADEAKAHGSHAYGIEHPIPRIAYPEHCHHGADGRHMSGGKGRETRPTAERVEAIYAVANKRRVVAHPRLR